MLTLLRCLLKLSSKGRLRGFPDVGSFQCRNLGGHPSVGLIVIGDEILKAQVKDTNSFFACNLLHEHGVRVQKVSIVRDNVQDIAAEMTDFSNKYDYVITSGGVGPTHDDLTYQALAVAFQDTLHYHPKLVDIVRDKFGYKNPSSSGYKMALIPTKATLEFGVHKTIGKPIPYPCVVLQNVFIFPGSPRFFELAFSVICKGYFSGNQKFATSEIFLNVLEETFAKRLSTLAKEHPNVAFGSYPESNKYYKSRITIESETQEETENARKKFCENTPKEHIITYDRAAHMDCLKKYKNFLEQSPSREVYQSSFEKFLNIYQNPEAVTICLDGSTESIILVHLARVAQEELQTTSKKLQAICFETNDFHTGVAKFLQEISVRYEIELSVLHLEKDILEVIKDHITSKPKVRTILIGKSLKSQVSQKNIYEKLERLPNLEHFEVHSPLIDWTEKDMTIFAASFSLPYYEI